MVYERHVAEIYHSQTFCSKASLTHFILGQFFLNLLIQSLAGFNEASPKIGRTNSRKIDYLIVTFEQLSHFLKCQLLLRIQSRVSRRRLCFRSNAFEVMGLDNTRSGVIHVEDTHSLHSWIQNINYNIALLNNQSVSKLSLYM